MKSSFAFLFLFSIILCLFPCGCVEREDVADLYISKVDVMSTPQGDGFKLTATVYVCNQQNMNTRALSIKVKARDPQTNLIVAEQTKDIGYLKASSQVTNTVSLTSPISGAQTIEVELFEDNIVVDEYTTNVEINSMQTETVPSDVILTDMIIEMQQVTNYGKDAVVDIYPGIFNPAGDSDAITIKVIAAVDPYTVVTGTDSIESIKAGERLRGTIRMTLPLDKKYDFNVQLIENGETIVNTKATDSVIPKEMKLKQPVTYNLIEAAAPIEEPTAEEPAIAEKPGTPGFSGLCAAIAVAFALIFMRRKSLKR